MNNRILKAFAPIVLASLLFQPTAAFALQGGPFDGGHNLGASAAGTYSGVLTGKNLIGLTQFGISDTSESNGRFAVFHEGIMNYGVTQGIADPANQRIAGVLLGVALLPGESDNPIAQVQGAGVTAGQTLSVRGAAEGAWTAEMKGFPIAITFEGEGEISTAANPVTVTSAQTVADAVTVTAAGTANNGGGNDPQTITATGVDATVTSTTLRATTPFEIRGSRTSLGGYNVLNSFSGIDTVIPATQ